MPVPAKKAKFGEWLPDQEALDNPGLTICQNAIFTAGNYEPYLPMANYGSGGALPYQFARCMAVRNDNNGTYVVAGVYDPIGHQPPKLYVSGGIGTAWSDVTTAGGLSNIGWDWSLAQYNNVLIAVNFADPPQMAAVATSLPGSAFSALTGVSGPAPQAGCVGVIGQFVILGNLFGLSSSAVQWSVINDPTNWPAPNTAEAVAGQSGIQYLNEYLGEVLGIFGGDQWGVIFCTSGLVRILYIGGNAVFQFDTFSREFGPISQNAIVKVGQKIYFAGLGGFRVTDGTTSVSIGDGRVDKTFIAMLGTPGSSVPAVHAGVDYGKKLIYWTVFTSLTTAVQFAYNYQEDKWTQTTDLIYAYVQNGELLLGSGFIYPQGIGSSLKLGSLTGSPGTALIETGEVELNPGARALVSGYRPQISGTSPTVSVKIGSRANQGSAVTYTASLTPNAITGFADALVDANYHRAQIQISGQFLQAIGGEFRAQPSGSF